MYQLRGTSPGRFSIDSEKEKVPNFIFNLTPQEFKEINFLLSKASHKFKDANEVASYIEKLYSREPIVEKVSSLRTFSIYIVGGLHLLGQKWSLNSEHFQITFDHGIVTDVRSNGNSNLQKKLHSLTLEDFSKLKNGVSPQIEKVTEAYTSFRRYHPFVVVLEKLEKSTLKVIQFTDKIFINGRQKSIPSSVLTKLKLTKDFNIYPIAEEFIKTNFFEPNFNVEIPSIRNNYKIVCDELVKICKEWGTTVYVDILTKSNDSYYSSYIYEMWARETKQVTGVILCDDVNMLEGLELKDILLLKTKSEIVKLLREELQAYIEKKRGMSIARLRLISVNIGDLIDCGDFGKLYYLGSESSGESLVDTMYVTDKTDNLYEIFKSTLYHNVKDLLEDGSVQELKAFNFKKVAKTLWELPKVYEVYQKAYDDIYEESDGNEPD